MYEGLMLWLDTLLIETQSQVEIIAILQVMKLKRELN